MIKQDDVADNFYLICEGIVEVAQEKSDFVYYDFVKKQNLISQLMTKGSFRKKRDNIKAPIQKRGVLDPDTVKNFRDHLTLKRKETNDINALHESEKENLFASEFKIINDLSQGSYFGEVAIMTNLRRTCSVYTISNCFLGLINEQTFKNFVSNYSDMKININRRINSYSDDLLTSL